MYHFTRQAKPKGIFMDPPGFPCLVRLNFKRPFLAQFITTIDKYGYVETIKELVILHI